MMHNSIWFAFVTAWNAHDAAELAAYFAADARLEFYDGNVYQGRNAIETFYRVVFARMPVDWLHTDPIAEGTGNNSAGTLSITHVGKPVIVLRYNLRLSSGGLIQHLTLTNFDTPLRSPSLD